ncbi:MAG: RNA recognition motif-containing protein [Thermoproteota archaeon]|jgi:RNA recognition motif-containing protein
MFEDSKIGIHHNDPSISTIYISNLAVDVEEWDIKDMFEEFGYVNYVKVLKHTDTGRSKCSAFLQMNNMKHAKYAISQLNDSEQFGTIVKVNLAEKHNDGREVKKARKKPYKSYIAKKDRPQPTSEIEAPSVI